MFNYRHRLENINQELLKVGHKIVKTLDVYMLLEFNKEPPIWMECGTYFKRKDIVEIANELLNLK